MVGFQCEGSTRSDSFFYGAQTRGLERGSKTRKAEDKQRMSEHDCNKEPRLPNQVVMPKSLSPLNARGAGPGLVESGRSGRQGRRLLRRARRMLR